MLPHVQPVPQVVTKMQQASRLVFVVLRARIKTQQGRAVVKIVRTPTSTTVPTRLHVPPHVIATILATRLITVAIAVMVFIESSVQERINVVGILLDLTVSIDGTGIVPKLVPTVVWYR